MYVGAEQHHPGIERATRCSRGSSPGTRNSDRAVSKHGQPRFERSADVFGFATVVVGGDLMPIACTVVSSRIKKKQPYGILVLRERWKDLDFPSVTGAQDNLCRR